MAPAVRSERLTKFYGRQAGIVDSDHEVKAGEEERGTLDLLLANPLPRWPWPAAAGRGARS